MKPVCLDTTLLVDLERGIPSAKEEIERLLTESYRLSTTTINIFEMAFGAHKSRKTKQNIKALMALTEDLDLWDFDLKSGFLAGELLHKLELKGTSIGFRDVFIASIAITRGCNRIVTSNVKDFKRIPGIIPIPYGQT
ncbi:MAG: type II toxin-antitoxin system VapC family toxin [Candidatus Thorarchaeota archaeon]|nr:MAG: type II toxin-antitoxin system VapC family toxin [Candidatus Thorarchaeota archaeon]